MPVCLLRLVQLKPYSISAEHFVARLLQLPESKIILASQIRYEVVAPVHIDVGLLRQGWHFLYLAESDAALPAALAEHVAASYSIWVGVPSRVLNNYKETNARLLSAQPPALTGSLNASKRKDSAQKLELSAELERKGAELSAHYEGPVTQLNLLHFEKGKKPEYVKYGGEFASSVGSRRGGNAKIVGTVIPAGDRPSDESGGKSGEGQGGWWNEIALVHYPSIMHFNDMLAGEDYQAANEKYRLKALRDTVLICTTEYDLAKLSRSVVPSAKL